jgi:hypothetical protein
LHLLVNSKWPGARWNSNHQISYDSAPGPLGGCNYDGSGLIEATEGTKRQTTSVLSSSEGPLLFTAGLLAPQDCHLLCLLVNARDLLLAEQGIVCSQYLAGVFSIPQCLANINSQGILFILHQLLPVMCRELLTPSVAVCRYAYSLASVSIFWGFIISLIQVTQL